MGQRYSTRDKNQDE
ncbi:hypothetical protein NP493_425g04016 [Ridgeia piscesae]|uniref:Uncharacterized protein n=1 Tax=Ridgeia piscesae TaxID=27915 RepID=A0AAD9NVA3_RIDPI|nr:hypothetical protein NP493_425g04016 [Ridgeia piscesae]